MKLLLVHLKQDNYFSKCSILYNKQTKTTKKKVCKTELTTKKKNHRTKKQIHSIIK